MGYAPGAYDLFHVGHLNLLRRARSTCDRLVAGIVSDELCLRMKGVRPIVPLDERVAIVGAIDVVDAVYVEDVPDKLVAWDAVRFHRIFKGDDWRGTPKGEQLELRMGSVGVEVVYFPYTHQTSSTGLRLALRQLDAASVAAQADARELRI
ncbi:adenylyltransferase/cytidyltransferase family protein [Nocardioides sp. cx-173]|uniref:adenylyltransferase/cytidyltransferase family protein n=1 Tax=Nocardioides sp. cx-173 TaxID=2898796 RepID=UPI001E5C0334|nr:adenylyltransferase/cytidyltransferase family protein [Nocardioides sp. cx-173]MCD4526668.1 adenylyltransferase/cytidyltransferase family protein [Nocardioides sp. cx-173]UGB42589.1 adenylyltransferase/cytidyltransferase family protein [Nocardioides sp. cx-173]